MSATSTKPVVANLVRRGFYLDSVALMRLSRGVASLEGIEEAGLMMGTAANHRILTDAGVMGPEGQAAQPGDLIIAIRARSKVAADTAIAEAIRLLDAPKAAGKAQAYTPKTIRAAAQTTPGANLVLVSVGGAFATAEARKALNRGLNVMMFSDNVPLVDEVALKQEARAKGLFVMGPDCGTAILGGVPLAFANVIPKGRFGIVGASGTGIQEVTCLLANHGGGISHAIGTGGRDLKAEVGGITMLMGIDALDADPDTDHIILISKPPAKPVAEAVLARVGRSKKPFTICFIGGTDVALPKNARLATTLKAAAETALGRSFPAPSLAKSGKAKGRLVRGLYAGGTLCSEAQVIARDAHIVGASNVPIPGMATATADFDGHTFIDLGDDEYTAGRPHPMIEPAVRDAPLAKALADPQVAVVLLDIVLGYGGHMDPAGHLETFLKIHSRNATLIVASVTGTEGDPQSLSRQRATLDRAGVLTAPSNADAVRLALGIIGAKL